MLVAFECTINYLLGFSGAQEAGFYLERKRLKLARVSGNGINQRQHSGRMMTSSDRSLKTTG